MSEIEVDYSVKEYHYSKNPTSLTKFLKTMLWGSLGISILSLLSDFMQMNLLSSGNFSQAAAESSDSRQQIIGILYLVAVIITGIAFLKWIHRMNSNCHGFEAQGMEFTPGWSIGYYFIPFINLYKPYRAMKEIWKVSTNPTNWRNESGSGLLGCWWALWIISNVLGQASFRMSMRANTISSLQESTTVSILSGIIDIPSYIVAVSLISTIFTKQEKLVKKNVQQTNQKITVPNSSQPVSPNRKAFFCLFLAILSFVCSILIIKSFWTSLSIFDFNDLIIVPIFILAVISILLGWHSIRKIKTTKILIKGKALSVFGIILSSLSMGLLLLPGVVFILDSIINPPNYNIVLQLQGASDRVSQSLLEETEMVISSRIRYYAEPCRTRIIPPDKLIVTIRMPGKFTKEKLHKIFKPNQLSFNLVHPDDEILAKNANDPDFNSPIGYELFGDGSARYLVKTKPELIENIKDADARINTSGQPYVLIELNPEGKDLFYNITNENIGRRLAIMIDDTVVSAPVIREPIKGGSLHLTGDFTLDGAFDLAFALKAGAIPLPVQIVSNGPVEPADAITKTEQK